MGIFELWAAGPDEFFGVEVVLFPPRQAASVSHSELNGNTITIYVIGYKSHLITLPFDCMADNALFA